MSGAVTYKGPLSTVISDQVRHHTPRLYFVHFYFKNSSLPSQNNLV